MAGMVKALQHFLHWSSATLLCTGLTYACMPHFSLHVKFLFLFIYYSLCLVKTFLRTTMKQIMIRYIQRIIETQIKL